VKTYILAGHETSASMLTWALYELTIKPDLCKRVVAEADAVFGPDNSPDTPVPPAEALHNLVITQCCLKEALRKYSVVPVVVREAIKDVQLCGKYFIPAGGADTAGLNDLLRSLRALLCFWGQARGLWS
jgi:cytochrome P450